MRICFLCGCVEPGKNGVGDYARRLAGQLIREGHEVFLVGIHDYFVNSTTEERQLSEGIEIEAFRWPATQDWKTRIEGLRKLVAEKPVTYISVQFVAYAFDQRGLPHQFVKLIGTLKDSAKFHFFVHELWYESGKMSLKQRATSYLQKRMIRKLLKATEPTVIHTSLPYYQAELEAMGFKSKISPIFSNIDPVSTSSPEEEGSSTKQKRILAGFFSQFSMHPSVCSFLESLQKDCDQHNLKLSIILIGGSPKKAEHAIQSLQTRLENNIGIKHTGYLDPAAVSEQLHQVDIGISPVSRHVIGKSGSTAAFLAHGKPVAIPHTEPGESPENIGFGQEPLKAALFTKPTLAAINESSTIARTMNSSISLESVASHLAEDLPS